MTSTLTQEFSWGCWTNKSLVFVANWFLRQIFNQLTDECHTHPAEINITSNLQSIETIRVRGLSKQTQYLDTYVRVLRKKFC